MIHAVLFDLDNTLVDDGPNWRRSVAETVQGICNIHNGVDVESLRRMYYAAAGSVWDEIRTVEAPPWGNMDDETIVGRVWAVGSGRGGTARP